MRMMAIESDPPDARTALRACRLFAELDDATVDLLAAAVRPRRFRRGEVVFHAGDPGDALFVVVAGRAKITLPAADGSESAILATVGPGGFFGALALLDGAPRSTTVVAIDGLEAGLLQREVFDRLLDAEPALRRALMRTLAGEIRRLTAQVEDLHFLDLPGRLARHLLRMVADPDEPPSDDPGRRMGERRLSWPFTQTELAGMIGGSRQSVNRLLSELVADGVLRFDGDDLVIPDVDRLAEAARR
jgi:CRP-like cAMP-binding protein